MQSWISSYGQVDLSDLMEKTFLEKIPDDEPVISYAPSTLKKLEDIIKAQPKELEKSLNLYSVRF